jgi:fermentation-respiration switch protein FrsA (DUF1100 family)
MDLRRAALCRRTMLGLLVSAAFAPVPAPAADGASESPLAVTSGRRRLFGTLALPAGAGPFPAVLIIAGSGPTDRDGNNPLEVRADTETVLRFEDEVTDAVTWLRLLARDRRFERLVIAGHSQGSLTGMLAAERIAVSAFVSLEGPGRPAGTILLAQLAAPYPPDIVARAREIVAQLEDGESANDVPPALYTLFRPSVQPYLMSWFPYDPAREITQLHCSITIVQGTADTQVVLADAQALHAAAPAARLVIVPQMTHTLKQLEPGMDEIRTYLDPSLPIAPAVVDAVTEAAQG